MGSRLIVLDTHAWLWWAAEVSGALSRRAERAIEEADRIGIAAFSCLELATLVARGRVALDRDVRVWVARSLALERVVPLDLRPDVAVAAALLPAGFPLNPGDRIIYATAQAEGATLVTKDRAIRAFDRAGTLW